MDHADHVALIRDGVAGFVGAAAALPSAGAAVAAGTWADLGSGRGAFTLALAELLPRGTIYSVDRDSHALLDQARAVHDRFPAVDLVQLVADFSKPLELPALDGVVMANSLHFERDKVPVLRLVRGYLREGGRFVLVEYDADRGNPWVPYPLSYRSWEVLALEAGFRETRRLSSVPSRFLGAIYSAVSTR